MVLSEREKQILDALERDVEPAQPTEELSWRWLWRVLLSVAVGCAAVIVLAVAVTLR